MYSYLVNLMEQENNEPSVVICDDRQLKLLISSLKKGYVITNITNIGPNTYTTIDEFVNKFEGETGEANA